MAIGTEMIAPVIGVMLALILVLVIWEAIWKGIAMWHAARNSQKAWYIFILILNTVGILPIIYLLFFRKKKAVEVKKTSIAVKKISKKKRK